jgi:pyridoxamine 5'-phosphate oxidase
MPETDAGQHPDPLVLFHEWVDGEEMVLATATPDGHPSARCVLVRGVDECGFTFFTSYASRKGRELEANPRAALLFRRDGIQVRVEGRVAQVPAEESDAYWYSRPAASRRSAAASHQSEVVASRAELAAAVAAQPEEPERPSWWGGYRLVPEVFEFWRGRDDRLHERLRFVADAGGWEVQLLQP